MLSARRGGGTTTTTMAVEEEGLRVFQSVRIKIGEGAGWGAAGRRAVSSAGGGRAGAAEAAGARRSFALP